MNNNDVNEWGVEETPSHLKTGFKLFVMLIAFVVTCAVIPPLFSFILFGFLYVVSKKREGAVSRDDKESNQPQ